MNNKEKFESLYEDSELLKKLEDLVYHAIGSLEEFNVDREDLKTEKYNDKLDKIQVVIDACRDFRMVVNSIYHEICKEVETYW